MTSKDSISNVSLSVGSPTRCLRGPASEIKPSSEETASERERVNKGGVRARLCVWGVSVCVRTLVCVGGGSRQHLPPYRFA